ncbi:uncharacterized protein LOC144063069 isoform X3 [Vanacampus margaritifer]
MRGYRGVKYFLFLFCYVFWVLSAVLIAVGIYAKVAKEKGDGADGASDDESRRWLSGGPRLGERHRLCAEEASVLRRGGLRGLVEERLLPVLRRQPQLGGLRRSLLLLRCPRQPDGAEHHVRVRDAAAGAPAGPAGRLPGRMFGQDRAVAQAKRQDGGRARRRAAASPDLRDVAGLGSGVLDQQSAPAQGGASEQERAEERPRLVSRLRRLCRPMRAKRCFSHPVATSDHIRPSLQEVAREDKNDRRADAVPSRLRPFCQSRPSHYSDQILLAKFEL